jgi:hypothetical protein
MIHGLATPLGGFNGDFEILFEFGLAGEIGEPGWAKCRFELTLALGGRRRSDTSLTHVVLG